jgi:hypothetical protein
MPCDWSLLLCHCIATIVAMPFQPPGCLQSVESAEAYPLPISPTQPELAVPYSALLRRRFAAEATVGMPR